MLPRTLVATLTYLQCYDLSGHLGRCRQDCGSVEAMRTFPHLASARFDPARTARFISHLALAACTALSFGGLAVPATLCWWHNTIILCVGNASVAPQASLWLSNWENSTGIGLRLTILFFGLQHGRSLFNSMHW